MYVGRLMPEKGVDVLISAMPPGRRLEVYGRPYDAEYFAELRRLAYGEKMCALSLTRVMRRS